MNAAFDLTPQRSFKNEAMSLMENSTFSRPNVSEFNRMNASKFTNRAEKIICMRREDFLAQAPVKVQEAKCDDRLVSASIETLNEALIAAFGLSPSH